LNTCRRRRLSPLIPSSGDAGVGGARSRAIRDRISTSAETRLPRRGGRDMGKSGTAARHPVKPFAARRDHRPPSTRANGAIHRLEGGHHCFLRQSAHASSLLAVILARHRRRFERTDLRRASLRSL
jgi:hypothetical protein